MARKYLITNRSNLPVNLDELGKVINPRESITVDAPLSAHLMELRNSKIIIVKNADTVVDPMSNPITESSNIPNRRRKSVTE